MMFRLRQCFNRVRIHEFFLVKVTVPPTFTSFEIQIIRLASSAILDCSAKRIDETVAMPLSVFILTIHVKTNIMEVHPLPCNRAC